MLCRIQIDHFDVKPTGVSISSNSCRFSYIAVLYLSFCLHGIADTLDSCHDSGSSVCIVINLSNQCVSCCICSVQKFITGLCSTDFLPSAVVVGIRMNQGINTIVKPYSPIRSRREDQTAFFFSYFHLCICKDFIQNAVSAKSSVCNGLVRRSSGYNTRNIRSHLISFQLFIAGIGIRIQRCNYVFSVEAGDRCHSVFQ